MKLKLPEQVHSPQDLNELLLEIRKLARWQSHESVKKMAGAKAAPAPEISKSSRELLSSHYGKKQPDGKSLGSLIEALEEIKDTAPTIAITLAASPGPKLKIQLTEWCRTQLSPDVLVDFSFDSNLLGGLVVRWGSHIYDWSFRRQILQNRRSFPEVLRRV